MFNIITYINLFIILLTFILNILVLKLFITHLYTLNYSPTYNQYITSIYICKLLSSL